MITLRDWFLGHGWTEGWAVTGAIVVALVAAVLFAELFRAVGPALLSKIARPKRSWVAAFQKRRVFRSAAWVLIVLVTESQMTPLLEPMATFVRELASDGRGIPVEIYAFSKDTRWTAYEHLQADIYDRALATLPEFDLRVFQEPTGEDVRELVALANRDVS